MLSPVQVLINTALAALRAHQESSGGDFTCYCPAAFKAIAVVAEGVVAGKNVPDFTEAVVGEVSCGQHGVAFQLGAQKFFIAPLGELEVDVAPTHWVIYGVSATDAFATGHLGNAGNFNAAITLTGLNPPA